MAFSFGFFNAKNLDRTYTAENFCDYLGSIICNGIQDNYGQCFKLTKDKLKLTIRSGKAWIASAQRSPSDWRDACVLVQCHADRRGQGACCVYAWL